MCIDSVHCHILQGQYTINYILLLIGISVRAGQRFHVFLRTLT